MASNVIGQQDGQGVFKFTNIDNKYGGATTTLVTLEDGKVSFGVPAIPSSKALSLATADTAASLTIDKDVVLVDNQNSGAATVTIAYGSTAGAVCHIVCTGTGTVNFGGQIYGAAGGAPQVVGKGGLTLVCGSDLNWYQVGLAA